MLRTARQLMAVAHRPMGRQLGPRLARFPAPLPVATAFRAARFATKAPPPDKATSDSEKRRLEKELAARTIEPRPDEVSVESSRQHLFEPATPASTGSAAESRDEVLGGVKQDLGVVKETFALSTVPREPYVFGLAGTLPYVATSMGTLFLTWDLGQTWPLSNIFLNTIYVTHDTAQSLLAFLEPLQVGYGAVIISFLGAIHWGMEWADSSSQPPSAERTRFRYGVGVLAPAIAWPSIMMPIEYALITQFAAFTGLYFLDSKAASRGWAPTWYGTYRFVLTFIVGSAIVISLVGRASLGEHSHRLTKPAIREALHPTKPEEDKVDWARLEREEKQKRAEEQEAKEKAEKEEKEKEKQKDKKAKGKKKGGDKEEENKKKGGKADEKKDEKTDGDEDDKDAGEEDAEESEGDDEKDDNEAQKGDKKGEKKDDSKKKDEKDDKKKGGKDGDSDK